MFIGFIAVIIILLVVVATMSFGSKTGENAAKYMTEAKQTTALIHQLQNESQFYYSKNSSYDGIGLDYFVASGFAKDKIVATSNMPAANWIGWPVGLGLPDPYTGPYIPVGGTAGDDIRIIITSLNDGKNFGVYILKKVGSTVPETYTSILEQSLSGNEGYIGG